MINYDGKAWIKVTFSIKGTVITRILGRIVSLAILTFALWGLREWRSDFEPLLKPFKPLGHTMVAVALGLLIVFRNNCSYDRYWEGRKLWGSLVNASRNLLRGASAYVENNKELANMVSAYALALKQHLRNNKDLSEIQSFLPPEMFQQVSSSANPPSMIAYHISRWIGSRVQEGKIDTITAQALEAHVRSFLDSQGGCERILRTPIPFAYAVHIKQLLFLYLVTLPFALVGELGWVAIPTVVVIAFGLLGIEEAGVEIEDPFGDDPNDLPIEAICATIGRDTLALAEVK
jgi:ion channel-forming bestrophin family protein